MNIEINVELRGQQRTLQCRIEGPDRSVGIFSPWLDDYNFSDGGEQLELTDDEVGQVLNAIQELELWSGI